VSRLRNEVDRCEREKATAEAALARSIEANQWVESELLLARGYRTVRGIKEGEETQDPEDDLEDLPPGPVFSDAPADPARGASDPAAAADGAKETSAETVVNPPPRPLRENSPHARDALRVHLNHVRRRLRLECGPGAVASARALLRLDAALGEIESLLDAQRAADAAAGLDDIWTRRSARLVLADSATQTREARVNEEAEQSVKEELERMRALVNGGDVKVAGHGSGTGRDHDNHNDSLSSLMSFGGGGGGESSHAGGQHHQHSHSHHQHQNHQQQRRQRRALGSVSRAGSMNSLASFGGGGGGGSIHESSGSNRSRGHGHGRGHESVAYLLSVVAESCPGEPEVRSETWAVSMLEVMLAEKIEADHARASHNEPPLSLATHVSEHFLDMFGHPGLAEPSLRDFLSALESLKATRVAAGFRAVFFFVLFWFGFFFFFFFFFFSPPPPHLFSPNTEPLHRWTSCFRTARSPRCFGLRFQS
jgi:hypothetical protein